MATTPTSGRASDGGGDAAGVVTLVREYRNAREQQVEARALARLGFTPVETGSAQGQIGIGRIALLGIFAAVFRPRARITVTYRGHGPIPTRDQINHAKAAASLHAAGASLAKFGRVRDLFTAWKRAGD